MCLTQSVTWALSAVGALGGDEAPDLNLRYATSAPSQSIDGTVTILAKATQSLSRFNHQLIGRGVWEPFLNDWVYGTKTPPMPGHPDWTVTPAGATARTLTAPPELPFHRR